MPIIVTESEKSQVLTSWGAKITGIVSSVKNNINKTKAGMLAFQDTFNVILSEMTAAGCTQAQIDEVTQIKADLVSIYQTLNSIDV